MVERKNKGEWSEFYVLLKLLADGKIFNADKNVRKMSNIFFPIIKIIREERQIKPVSLIYIMWLRYNIH